MTPEPEILNELQKITEQLNQLNKKQSSISREFILGLFRSLGYALGTVLIVIIGYYFLSKINFGHIISNYFQSLLPQSNPVNVLFSQPLLDQL